jgi:hypothetical protein
MMKNRVTGLEWVAPGDLDDHPRNWRLHSSAQKAVLTEAMEKIGVSGAVLAYRAKATGRLTVIDGHLRKDVLRDEEKVPVLVLDVDDVEAEALLATFDPVAQMATANDLLYQQIVSELQKDERFADLMRAFDEDSLAGIAGGGEGRDSGGGTVAAVRDCPDLR